MKFQTISLVAGTRTCNAACPFCVSKMTGLRLGKVAEPINARKLRKALKLCELGGVTSALITGKGEPTLYPEHIDSYLTAAGDQFPFMELQTNGSMLKKPDLRDWAYKGLTTVMISNCGFDDELNRQIYFPKTASWINLEYAVNICHAVGLIVRYTTVGIKGGVDSIKKLEQLMEFTKNLGIEQVSWRPVGKPDSTDDAEATQWVAENGLDQFTIDNITSYVKSNGELLYSLVHGAAVYDFRGQNLCLTNCLTKDADHDDETLRQLIFFPDGSLYTDWQLKGSRLL